MRSSASELVAGRVADAGIGGAAAARAIDTTHTRRAGVAASAAIEGIGLQILTAGRILTAGLTGRAGVSGVARTEDARPALSANLARPAGRTATVTQVTGVTSSAVRALPSA